MDEHSIDKFARALVVRIFNSQVPYTQLFPPSFLPLSTVPPISLRSFLCTQATFSGTLQSLSPRPPSSSAFLIPPLCVCVCVVGLCSTDAAGQPWQGRPPLLRAGWAVGGGYGRGAGRLDAGVWLRLSYHKLVMIFILWLALLSWLAAVARHCMHCYSTACACVGIACCCCCHCCCLFACRCCRHC